MKQESAPLSCVWGWFVALAPAIVATAADMVCSATLAWNGFALAGSSPFANAVEEDSPDCRPVRIWRTGPSRAGGALIFGGCRYLVQKMGH